MNQRDLLGVSGQGQQEECLRCGKCCEAGGAALHKVDLPLVKSGMIPLNRLITIRKGEPVVHPLAKKLQPAAVELVKLVGKGDTWICCCFDTLKGCTIYENRPQACRLLRCWDPSELIAIVEKDTLCRLDILAEDDPMVKEITAHDKLCPATDLLQLSTSGKPDAALQTRMTKLVKDDLHFRQHVVAVYRLQLHQELFYFGRPLFQILQQFGVMVRENRSELQLDWQGWRC